MNGSFSVTNRLEKFQKNSVMLKDCLLYFLKKVWLWAKVFCIANKSRWGWWKKPTTRYNLWRLLQFNKLHVIKESVVSLSWSFGFLQFVMHTRWRSPKYCIQLLPWTMYCYEGFIISDIRSLVMKRMPSKQSRADMVGYGVTARMRPNFGVWLARYGLASPDVRW